MDWITTTATTVTTHGNTTQDNIQDSKDDMNTTTILYKELTTSIAQQVQVFRWQLEMAIQYQRPVCIHCVQAFGPLLETITTIKRQYNSNKNNNKNKSKVLRDTFPISKIYFHAFGGKHNTVLQILSLCEGMKHKKSNTTSIQTTTTCTLSSAATVPTTKCYFGFAPGVNFRSPKTVDIIRTIGISRLLLETDHEDVSLVSSSLNEGMQYIATALDLDTTTVIEQTTKNAMEFYNISYRI